MSAFKVSALVVALVMLAALLWIGGEMHYRGCIDAARTAYPVVTGNGFFGDGGGMPDVHGSRRRARIAQCSRLPF